jgi:hypothetical protein
MAAKSISCPRLSAAAVVVDRLLRDIRRLSVLKAAAAFAASRSDLKSADVLAIAGRWLTLGGG